MANIKAQKRNIRVIGRRNELNRWKRARIRGSNKRLLDLIEAGKKEDAEKELTNFFSLLDKGVKTNLLKANAASRKKSRLARQVASIGTGNPE